MSRKAFWSFKLTKLVRAHETLSPSTVMFDIQNSLVLALLNFPRSIRHVFSNMFSMGIIPGNGKKEANSTVHPYLEILEDELISLTNAEMYDTYVTGSGKRGNFVQKFKIELLTLSCCLFCSDSNDMLLEAIFITTAHKHALTHHYLRVFYS